MIRFFIILSDALPSQSPLQKKTPTESECERENQELRTQVDKLLLEEQKERICPPLELQRA